MKILIGNKYYTAPEIEMYFEWCEENGLKTSHYDSLEKYRTWQKENNLTVTRHGVEYHLGDTVYHKINGKKMIIVSIWQGVIDCKDEERNIHHLTAIDISHSYETHIRFLNKIEEKIRWLK